MEAKRIGTVVALGALAAFVAAIYGTLATVVTTMNPQGLALRGPSLSDAEIQRFGRPSGGPADADALIGALEEVAAVHAETKALAATPAPSVVPEAPRSAPSADEQAARRALREGDCAGAADHALAAATTDPADAPLVEEAWRCFDAGGANLGQALASATSQPGDPATFALAQRIGSVEGRLSTMQTASDAGFGPYLDDLVGAASLSATATSALNVEALLGEWALAGGAGAFDPSFLADRIQALSGGLAGAPGEHLAAHDPAAYAALGQRLDAMMARTGASPDLQRAWMAGLTLGTTPPLPPTPSSDPTPDDGLPESAAEETDTDDDLERLDGWSECDELTDEG